MIDEVSLTSYGVETLCDLAPPMSIAIHVGSSTPLVTIHPDGTLTYGPGYTPDAAAQAFWDAIIGYHPLKAKG